jgi:acid phosphatase type 7
MTEMREWVVPLLEQAGVDLVLCGHSHVYERSYLLYGHYGFSNSLQPAMVLDARAGKADKTGAYVKVQSDSGAAVGTVYVVAGSAGHATNPKKLHGLDHPAMYRALNVPGSFVVDISGPRLDGFFIDETGSQLDSFTILRPPSR